MKKLIILSLTIIFLLTGCTAKNFKYYKNVSDTVISFYNSSNYDNEKYAKEDLPALETYLSKLTHENQEVNISDYIVKSDEYYTEEANTEGVWIKDDKCYIKYEDLGFSNANADTPSDSYEMEPYKRLVCNNYFTILYESSFHPDYSTTTSNLRNNYIYLDGYKTKGGYEFIYRSAYDGTGMKVTLNLKNKTIVSIDTSIADINSYVE
jgi:hypothetical protein